MSLHKNIVTNINARRQFCSLSVFAASHRRFVSFPCLQPLARLVVGFVWPCTASYIHDVSSQPHPTSSNHSTTNIIKTPLLIMVNTICSHEGCTRKPMKHGNGSCHLHGVHRKCSFPQCLNNARRAGVCVQHGSKKKQCSENGCTNNAVRKGVCINHGAKRYSRLNARTLVIRGEWPTFTGRLMTNLQQIQLVLWI